MDDNKRSQVRRSSLIAYGLGSGAEGLMANIIYALALPIYSIGYGIDAAVVGLAIAIPRVFDAITDPVMGSISDNARFRMGRRRPFILIGALLTAAFCALLWAPPRAITDSSTALLTWFVCMSSLYLACYTVFSVPYQALGYELAESYDERTRVMSYKTFFGNTVAILLMPLAYKLCFTFGATEIEGVRVVGVLFACVMAILGVSPAFFCRERVRQSHQPRISFGKSLLLSLRNRPFLLVIGIVVLTITTYFLAYPLQLYINLAYVVPGEREQAATLAQWMAVSSGVVGLVAVFPIHFLARRFEKMTIMFWLLVLMAIGSAASWWFFDPAAPLLQIAYAVLTAPALTGMWIISASYIADICDVEEASSNLRLEGMYGAVFALIRKLCVAAVIVLSGAIISASGFDRTATIQAASTGTFLRAIHAFGPLVLIVGAGFCCLAYPYRRKEIQSLREAAVPTPDPAIPL